jgi:hypothetical protein
MSTLGITLASVITNGANALAGSTFNGADASPDASATVVNDPTGGADTTNYSSGAKDNDVCPGIGTGTAPDKDDLDKVYFGTESNASGVFIYLGWHRISTSGTTTIALELNQSSAIAPCAPPQGNPARTAGDLLVQYDFSGGGGSVTISKSTWVGTAAAGSWSAPVTLVSPAVEDSVNAAGDFGEFVINATDPTVGLLPAGVCENFASAFVKSKASNSGSAAIKDFTTPLTQRVSNCGHIDVKKVDDTPGAANPVGGAVFTLYTNTTPGGVDTKGPAVVPAQTCTTDAVTGLCTISSITPAGKYWLSETTTPAGYTAAADQMITVAVAGNTPANPVTFVDARKPGSVTITKQDDQGVPAKLAGATFELYTNTTPGGVDTIGVATGKTCTTAGAAGTCTISNILPAGTYWLKETATPAGYTTAADTKITVALDTETKVTITDNRQGAAVNISKTDDAVPPAAVDGATFTLFTNTTPGGVDTKGPAVVPAKTCTTAGGVCSMTGVLPPGTYWVSETTTPAGYNTAADQKIAAALGGVINLTFVDARKPATINITKTDDAARPAPLNGATFTLFTNTTPGGVDTIGPAVAPAKTCTTAGGGLCSITNILPAGTYWVRETTTPAGYVTAADQKVTVGLDGTANLTFVDAKIPPPPPPVVLGSTMAVSKTVNGVHPLAGSPLVVEAGSTLTYVLTVKNTGAQSMTVKTLVDSLVNPLPATCTSIVGSVLAPGATATCTYTAIANGPANNVVTATALDAAGLPLMATDGTFVSPIHPAISLTKTAPTGAHIGDAVPYAITIINSGDVPLSGITVTDPKCSAAPVLQSKTGGNQDALLDKGEVWTYTCTHLVTAADGSSLVNTAIATGLDPLTTLVRSQGSATVAIAHPAITLVKTATPASVNPGQTVTYSYLVTNVGDVPLTNVTVNDNVLGLIGTIASLAPGASQTLTRAVVITATSPITNIGTVAAVDPFGAVVNGTSTATITIVEAEVLVKPQLPNTGAPIAGELRVAGILGTIGLALLFVAWRRRPEKAVETE